jgi:hypothetical protein
MSDPSFCCCQQCSVQTLGRWHRHQRHRHVCFITRLSCQAAQHACLWLAYCCWRRCPFDPGALASLDSYSARPTIGSKFWHAEHGNILCYMCLATQWVPVVVIACDCGREKAPRRAAGGSLSISITRSVVLFQQPNSCHTVTCHTLAMIWFGLDVAVFTALGVSAFSVAQHLVRRTRVG